VNRTFADLLVGRSQSKIARDLGVHRQQVHRWAKGLSMPTVERIPALAKILDVSVEELTLSIAGSATRVSEEARAS